MDIFSLDISPTILDWMGNFITWNPVMLLITVFTAVGIATLIIRTIIDIAWGAKRRSSDPGGYSHGYMQDGD